jgi:hypothetical protein
MRQDERKRIRSFTSFVNKVNSRAANVGFKMRELVENFFLRSPIIEFR